MSRESAPGAGLTHDSRLPTHDWEAFSAANPDLLTWKPSLIDALYRPETVSSEHARQVFVLPDKLQPLF